MKSAAISGEGFERLLKQLGKPTASALGTGAMTAGLSVLGNATNGELEEKGIGRVATEALMAGLAGGVYGGRLPSTKVGTENFVGKFGVAPNRAAMGALGLGASVAYGGLGGLIGGGISNAADLVGIPGFNANTGSSNTPGAKASMQAQSSAQPLDPRLAYGSPVDEYSAYIASQYPYAWFPMPLDAKQLIRYGLPIEMGVHGGIDSAIGSEDVGASILNVAVPAGLSALAIGLAGKYMPKGIKDYGRGAAELGAGIGGGLLGRGISGMVNSQLQQNNVPGFRNEEQRKQANLEAYINAAMQKEQAELSQPQYQQAIVPEAYGSSNTYYA